jgi:hypothetical protein
MKLRTEGVTSSQFGPETRHRRVAQDRSPVVSEPSRRVRRKHSLLDLKQDRFQQAKVRSKYTFYAFPVLQRPSFHGLWIDGFRHQPIHPCVEASMEFRSRDPNRLVGRCPRLDVTFPNLHSDKRERDDYSDCRDALPNCPARNRKSGPGRLHRSNEKEISHGTVVVANTLKLYRNGAVGFID